jgi:polyhydroxyalkanoate synthesis regulator phasin
MTYMPVVHDSNCDNGYSRHNDESSYHRTADRDSSWYKHQKHKADKWVREGRMSRDEANRWCDQYTKNDRDCDEE